MIYPINVVAAVQNNADANAYFMNEQARIINEYNHSFMVAQAKGAFAGISALCATGLAITGAGVVIHALAITGAALALAIVGVSGVGIIAITASIIVWVILANQSDDTKVEKEAELRTLNANVNRNIQKDPNYYQKHLEVT